MSHENNAPASSIHLSLCNVTKEYRTPRSCTLVLDAFTLSVADRSFTAILGTNGCGKTTLLNVIAGLTSHDGGSVALASSQSPTKISYVFQHGAATLFPWRTCIDNVSFPLHISGVPARTARDTSMRFLEEFRLHKLATRFPYEISGGQKQLLALCRALVSQPTLLLLDEPYVGLDYDNRLLAEELLSRTVYTRGITTIMVSHELDEGLLLGDELLLLSGPPCHIDERIRIPLPHPRDRSMLTAETLLRARQQAVLLTSGARQCAK